MSSRFPARFGLRGQLLMTGAAVLLAFTAVIGVLGIRANARTPTRGSKRMFEGSVQPLSELGIARAKFNENRAFTNNHILERTAAEKAKRSTRSRPNGAVVDENLAEVKATLGDDHGKQLFTELTAATRDVPRAPAARCWRSPTPARTQEAYALNKQKRPPARPQAADVHALFDSKVAPASDGAARE